MFEIAMDGGEIQKIGLQRKGSKGVPFTLLEDALPRGHPPWAWSTDPAG